MSGPHVHYHTLVNGNQIFYSFSVFPMSLNRNIIVLFFRPLASSRNHWSLLATVWSLKVTMRHKPNERHPNTASVVKQSACSPSVRRFLAGSWPDDYCWGPGADIDHILATGEHFLSQGSAERWTTIWPGLQALIGLPDPIIQNTVYLFASSYGFPEHKVTSSSCLICPVQSMVQPAVQTTNIFSPLNPIDPISIKNPHKEYKTCTDNAITR